MHRYLSPVAKDLFTKILLKDPEKRLGGGIRGAAEIKEHEWFKDVQWDDYVNTRIEPPYIPELDSPEDLKHFDAVSEDK